MLRLVLIATLLTPTVTAPVAPAAAQVPYSPSFAYRVINAPHNDKSPFAGPAESGATDEVHAWVRFERRYAGDRHSLVITPRFLGSRGASGLIVDEAYLRAQVAPDWHLMAGKKHDPRGPGVLANPSDVLMADRGLFDPLRQTEGVALARLEYAVDAATTIAGGYLPDHALLQVDTKVAGVAAHVTMIHSARDKSTTGVTLQRIVFPNTWLYADARLQSRQQETPRAAFGSYKPKDKSAFLLGGLRYAVTPKTLLVLEGAQQQNGLSTDEIHTYYDALRLRPAVEEEPDLLIGRRYAHAQLTDESLVPDWRFQANHVLSVNDKSSLSILAIQYRLAPELIAELAGWLRKGDENSEFGASARPRQVRFLVKAQL